MRTIFNIITQGACLGLLALVVSGCNSLYYFPDQVDYVRPDKLKLSYQEHNLDEADGTRLNLWHIAPAAGKDRRAVVVHFHGNAQNMSAHFLFVAWLAKAGYDVVTFDYRGYGRSSGVPERAGLFRDGRAVLDWVRQAPELRGKDVIVFGQSLGGAVATVVVAEAPPGQVKVLAVESTFASYRDLAQAKLADVWLTWPFQVPLSYLISDEDSPVAYAPRLRLPFLSIHGTVDPVIPLAEGKALYDAVGSKDKEFWSLPGEGHTPAFAAEETQWQQPFIKFLCGHAGRC
ncbi:MAG: alpha/beta hydrolase [Proteobacteria bacterium]|nr:alpha/beta hydrolase [Pseudomonadota bacterium]